MFESSEIDFGPETSSRLEQSPSGKAERDVKTCSTIVGRASTELAH